MQYSQLAPLPVEVPFRIVSKTIGQGAYACIKKAAPLKVPEPVFAVKFIHRNYALRYGNIKLKQLLMEVTLHKHVGVHQNIIQCFDSGQDDNWTWIAMELAEGGDLFDKIEADSGVAEDIAHVYFSQLINAIGYIHSKGVGHRDIKPENILLSSDGDLKIADFGLATLYEYQGKRKINTTLCGSPPYIAPEVLNAQSVGYYADMADIWSCGVVLFVLLAGNTPWSRPVAGMDEYGQPNEFSEYISTNGRSKDELWQALPSEVLSLLRGMMRVDVQKRFSLEDVRRHPWFTRSNQHLSPDGRLTNPLTLATNMFESLHISFDLDPLAGSQRSTDAMVIDKPAGRPVFASTQPETPIDDMLFDWERPQRSGLSSTQPLTQPVDDVLIADRLADEPSMSQFAMTPAVPMSRTQMARKFRDILPAHSLTRFFSLWTLNLLVPLLTEALHRLGIPLPPMSRPSAQESEYHIRFKSRDPRGCALNGEIALEIAGEGVFEVTFIKREGDPLEWRRLFKKVAILCKDAVFKPDT
ncbi:MAG: hypothetical protein Q9227_000489 [Pyrenula ochraceoflavens]